MGVCMHISSLSALPAALVHCVLMWQHEETLSRGLMQLLLKRIFFFKNMTVLQGRSFASSVGQRRLTAWCWHTFSDLPCFSASLWVFSSLSAWWDRRCSGMSMTTLQHTARDGGFCWLWASSMASTLSAASYSTSKRCRATFLTAVKLRSPFWAPTRWLTTFGALPCCCLSRCSDLLLPWVSITSTSRESQSSISTAGAHTEHEELRKMKSIDNLLEGLARKLYNGNVPNSLYVLQLT